MKFKFIGWNNKDEHDKVWVCIPLGNPNERCVKWLAAYGRRGKKIRTKIYDLNEWDMKKICDNKEIKRGYMWISPNELNKVYPEFESDLEATTMWTMLDTS